MALSTDVDSIKRTLADAQPHLETIRAGAVELLRRDPDPERINAASNALTVIKEMAEAQGAEPIVEAAGVVEEAMRIVVNHAGDARNLGHYVTAVAADLTRVVHAVAVGQDPIPIVEHARSMLRAMPRDETTELVEIDLNDREQLARVLAAVTAANGTPRVAPKPTERPAQPIDDSTRRALPAPQPPRPVPRFRALHEALAAYATQIPVLFESPERTDALDDLLRSARSLQSAAGGANVEQVERVAGCVARVIDLHRSMSRPLTPDAVEFIVACQRIIPMILDAADQPERVSRAVDVLVEQSANLLIQLRRTGQPLENFWPDEGTLPGPAMAGLAPPPTAGSAPAESDDAPGHAPLDQRGILAVARPAPTEADEPGERAAAPSPPPPAPRDDAVPPDPAADEAKLVVGELATRLRPALVEATLDLERAPATRDTRDRVRRLVQAIANCAKFAGAPQIAEQCTRVEHLAARSASDDAVTAEVHRLCDALERYLAGISTAILVEPGSLAHAERSTGSEAIRHLINLVGDLAVKSGGQEQRSRRFATAIHDLESARDRLRALAREAERAGIDREGLLGGIAEIAADLAVATDDLESLRGEFDALWERQSHARERLDRGIRRLHLVPAGALANRLERACLGAARQTAKRVHFFLDGAETELDRSTMEAVGVAAVELVRNAVEHGIELPAVRQSIGKPDQGTVQVRAYRDGSQVVVQVSDDGAGIDDRPIVRQAVESGYPLPPQGLTREQVLRYLFFPGFHARRGPDGTVGQPSGLETASIALSRVRGTITVESDLGRGTTFTLRVPLAPALVDVPVVAISGERYAIPFAEIEPVDAARVDILRPAEDGYVASVGGEWFPTVDLGSLLGVRSAHHVMDPGGDLLMVTHGDERWLVRVDGLLDRQSIDLQPVESRWPKVPGAVAMTTLASGQIAPVLDLAQLLDSASRPRRRRARLTATLTRVPFALVADDSVSARRSLAQLLERDGWRVIEARDGMETRELLESASPDLVILDLDLPLLDAARVIAVARSRTGIPIIGLAAASDERSRATALGVDACVTRPWDADGILRAIRQVTVADAAG